MIRKFLFEIIDEIRQSDDKKSKIEEYMNRSREFRDFIDITYNKKYNWEFDNNYKKTARNKREKGGVSCQWCEVIHLIKHNLLRNNKESVNFSRKLDRYLENCNQKDIDILLCVLKNRSIRYVNTKKIYEYFPELENKENND